MELFEFITAAFAFIFCLLCGICYSIYIFYAYILAIGAWRLLKYELEILFATISLLSAGLRHLSISTCYIDADKCFAGTLHVQYL